MNYVAAFRTHTLNEGVEKLARRFFDVCPSARQVVLADETKGPLGITGYELISHTDDLAGLGVAAHPAGRALWYNVDYGFYFIRKALPEFDYYLFCESDVSVCADLEPIVAWAAENKVDLIAQGIMRSSLGWHWHENGLLFFESPWRSLLVCTIISGKAVDVLLDARKRYTESLRQGQLNEWPFCESFVPSVLKEAGMRMTSWSDFVDVENLEYRPRIPLTDARANRPNSLSHSVMDTKTLIEAVMRDHAPQDWFDPKSQMCRDLIGTPFSVYVDALSRSFQSRFDHIGLAKLRGEALKEGIVLLESEDLAFCKPAMTSSVSAYSIHKDPCKDAARANSASLPDDYAFHTDEESNPWWMVDLIDEFVINSVHITNRSRYQERFQHFMIQSSRDGADWLTRHVKLSLEEISSDSNHPFKIEFMDPFLTRYVRITLIGIGVLHLRRVKVYGRTVLPPREAHPF